MKFLAFVLRKALLFMILLWFLLHKSASTSQMNLYESCNKNIKYMLRGGGSSESDGPYWSLKLISIGALIWYGWFKVYFLQFQDTFIFKI